MNCHAILRLKHTCGNSSFESCIKNGTTAFIYLYTGHSSLRPLSYPCAAIIDYAALVCLECTLKDYLIPVFVYY